MDDDKLTRVVFEGECRVVAINGVEHLVSRSGDIVHMCQLLDGQKGKEVTVLVTVKVPG